jgi:methenyltetrahydrofolate cyclohydrolase
MTLASTPLTKLLEEFRSSAPTPGGGSAAAIAGALGASLVAMVTALPKPRAATSDEVERLQKAGERATALARQLEALIDRDSEAYESVVSAYRLPKGTEEEKAARSAGIQTAMQQAIEAPLDVMRACAEALTLAPIAAAYGNANASSDVQVGVELLRAGRQGARLNIEINLGSIKDRDYAAKVEREVARLSESGAGDAPNASA